jgi:hypothetical protein
LLPTHKFGYQIVFVQIVDKSYRSIEMSGKQRKFRIRASAGDEEDGASPKENAAAPQPPPPPRPASAISKPVALLSFDEDAGDDGPASMAPKKKSLDKDRKPKLGRAPVPAPESVPVVGTTQRSNAGAHGPIRGHVARSLCDTDMPPTRRRVQL